MFKGLSTHDLFEQCVKRGFCKNHIKEVIQNGLTDQQNELPQKTFLFIRINILYTVLLKKTSRCEKIKRLLQKTPLFSRLLAKGDITEASDAIFTLDSIVVFILCHLSKVCCVGIIFQKNEVTLEDPELKHIQNLLLADRFEGHVLYHLLPLLQKNFAGIDLALVKLSCIITLLFVRNYCVNLNFKTAFEIIEEDLKGDLQWKNFNRIGDNALLKGNYGDARKAYSSAIMLNSYSFKLYIQRARTYLKMGLFKAAQMDAYMAVAVNPRSCEGYHIYVMSLYHQKLIQDALNVVKYSLSICASNEPLYAHLQELLINMEKRLLNKELLNNVSENSINHENISEKTVSEKEFPVLVDSDSDDSESEDRRKNVPELVEASDSDESETVVKKTVNSQPKNKTKKKRIPHEDPSDVPSTETDMVKIRTSLKAASEAILSDCGYTAVQIFRGPLRDFIDSSKLNTFNECEVVCIKYAYGTAYYKSGEYDDLLKCITIFKEIMEKHESITFPAAFYALGLSYRKLNRFKEALSYLETVQSFLSKGIHFKVYPWPELPTVIQETKCDILKVLVEDLIKECENPPNPDALCRFAFCTYQPSIYYSDPDFKGYISILCSEQCCLQYHLQCWKTMKTDKKFTDKEFLEQVCFTPDCDGVIIKIQNIDRKGDLAKEFTSDVKKTGKQKWAKWEKKADVKEKKKKRTNSRSEDGIQEVPSENGKTCSRKNSDSNEKFLPFQALDTVSPPAERDSSSSESILKSLQKMEPLESDVSNKCNDICSSPLNTIHERKGIDYVSAKSEFSKSVLANFSSSEEEKDCSNVLETLDIPHVSEKENESSTTQNTTVPSDFSNETKFIAEAEQEQTSQYHLSQCIRDNVYSYMYEYLQHHGPLRTDDPLLIDELSSFPGEVNTMIAECGSIGEFLKHDLRFAFVGNIYICVVSDLAKAYRMNSNSSLPTDLESLQSLESADNSKYYNKCDTDTKRQSFGLNPDAIEYTPIISSVNDDETNHKLFDNDSFAKNLNNSKSLSAPESFQFPSDSAKTSDESQNFVSEVLATILGSELYDNLKLLPSTAHSECNVNAMNHNQKYSNNNVCASNKDLSPSDINGEKQSNYSLSSGDERLKEIETVMAPFSTELCDESSADVCLKPPPVIKLSETVTMGTNTDFVNTDEVTATEQLRCLTDSLKAQKNRLEQQNLSLKAQLASSKTEISVLSEEVLKLRESVSSSRSDLEVCKEDYKKKEEALLDGREYLLKSLTDSHNSIDEHKKRIEFLEGVNSGLKKMAENFSASLKEADEKMKNAVIAEKKKHSDIISNLQKENDELRYRVKYAEIQFLETKKNEFSKRIEDKCHDVSMKKQEFTRGMSMFSGNLNPVLQSSMKTIFSQQSSYVNQLQALKLEFLKQIDKQIEKVEEGASLIELEEIKMKNIPDPPQSVYPGFDKSLLNPMGLNLLNMGSFPQIPSASVIPQATASAANALPVPPLAVIPPAGLSAAQATPAATIIPQAVPSATIIPQATPCASSQQHSAKTIQPMAPSATIIPPMAPSVLSSVIPTVEADQKKKLDTPKVPPGLMNCATSLVSSRTTLGSSKDSLETFPIGDRTLFGSVNSVSKANEPGMNSLAQGLKKAATGNKIGDSYHKLLMKLKEHFPSYDQEELMDIVKEFRSKRKGKLTGLPIDAIISELKPIINSKQEAERRIQEQKVQPKVLVNKKLVPDPRAPVEPQQQCVKKKAWSCIDSDNKTFTGNPDDDCTICCDPMTPTSAYKVACGHAFHEQCIRQWLRNKSNCPVCRVLLLLPEEYPSLS